VELDEAKDDPNPDDWDSDGLVSDPFICFSTYLRSTSLQKKRLDVNVKKLKNQPRFKIGMVKQECTTNTLKCQ
jgi:hypothetical protein